MPKSFPNPKDLVYSNLETKVQFAPNFERETKSAIDSQEREVARLKRLVIAMEEQVTLARADAHAERLHHDALRVELASRAPGMAGSHNA